MKFTRTCPYCNAVLPLSEHLKTGQWTSCPRCQESFRIVGEVQAAPENTTAATAGTPAEPAPAVPRPLFSPEQRRTNRRIGWGVVSLMVAVASVALVFALNTQERRRANDAGIKDKMTRRPRQPDIPDDRRHVPPARPEELAGLRALMPYTDLVAALHVAEILQDERIRAAVLPTALPRLGTAENLLAGIERVSGVSRQQMHHVVLGTRLGKLDGAPTVQLAVHLREPCDEATIRRHLEVKEKTGIDGKKVFAFSKDLPVRLGNEWLQKLYRQGWVHFRDDGKTFTLTWGLVRADVSRLWGSPYLPEELLTLLRDEVRPAGPFWLAGFNDDWAKSFQALLRTARTFGIDPGPLKEGQIPGVSKEDIEALGQARVFALWLYPLGGRTLLTAVRCKDSAGVGKMKELLQRLYRGEESKIRFDPDPPQGMVVKLVYLLDR